MSKSRPRAPPVTHRLDDYTDNGGDDDSQPPPLEAFSPTASEHFVLQSRCLCATLKQLYVDIAFLQRQTFRPIRHLFHLKVPIAFSSQAASLAKQARALGEGVYERLISHYCVDEEGGKEDEDNEDDKDEEENEDEEPVGERGDSSEFFDGVMRDIRNWQTILGQLEPLVQETAAGVNVVILIE